MPDIMHLVRINASPERVYEAVTTAEGIRRWWTRDAVLEPKIGGAGEFGFNERRFVAKVRVDELEPPVRVRWTVFAGAMGRGRASGADARVRATFARRRLLCGWRSRPDTSAVPKAGGRRSQECPGSCARTPGHEETREVDPRAAGGAAAEDVHAWELRVLAAIAEAPPAARRTPSGRSSGHPQWWPICSGCARAGCGCSIRKRLTSPAPRPGTS
jgi:uncharacterized protein YndB with AHSA1/START domain